MKQNFLKSLFVFALSFTMISPAYAVDPASETAGAESTRFEREWEQERDTRPPRKVPLTSEDYIEDETSAQRTIPQGSTFRLNSVTFTGNESISSQDLDQVVNSYLGRDVGIADLRDVAGEVKKLYRDKGYVAAYVYVPPQNIAGGNVEIAVIEGRVGNVEVEGNKWFSEKVIRRALGVKLGKVLFYNTLSKGLTYINKKKDIKAKSVLRPGSEQGTTDVLVNVEDNFPGHITTDLNNLGTQNTGKTRWGVGVSYDNLFGQMDRLAGRFQIGKGVTAVGANYLFPIHETGTTLAAGYSYSKVDLQGDLEALDVEGSAHSITTSIIQDLYANDNLDLKGNIGFDLKEIENEVLGARAGKDSLRILNVGLNAEFTDKWGKTFSPHSVHFGFENFLGSSEDSDRTTRLNSGGDFFIYRGNITRYHRLPWDMLLAVRGQIQITNDRLPPSEQLRLGGAFSVRGYEEGEYQADDGFFIASELYIPTYFFPEDWMLPWAEKPLRKQIQGTVFYDFGMGWIEDQVVGEENRRTLAGVGFGVRIHLYDRLFARFQWATPTGSDARNGSDSSFHYGISAELL